MNKCIIDNSIISSEIGNLTTLYSFNEIDKNEFFKRLKDVYKNLTDTYTTDNNYEDLAQVILEIALEWGLVEEFGDKFNLTNIQSELCAIKDNVYVSNNEINIEQLENPNYKEVRSLVSRDFLYEAYGTATIVLNYFLNNTNNTLFDCFFINRHSSFILPGEVHTNEEVNRNLREYLEILFKNIVDYLNYIRRRSLNAITDKDVIQILENPVLYDLNNKYTGNLEKLSVEIERFISSFTPNNLIQFYTTMNSVTADDSLKNEEKLKIDAFNSAVMLNNFDSYLKLLFTDILQIKDFNVKTGENKYNLGLKTTKISTTWRVNENIDVEKESDFVTRMAVNTSPLYDAKTKELIPGKYLRFLDFQHLVSKVKELILDPRTNIEPLDNFLEKVPNLFTDLEKRKLKGKTLRRLVCEINKNQNGYSHLLFLLLSNDQFLKDNKNLFKDYFTRDELNKLYSLNRNLFNGNESIRGLSDSKYYSNITLCVGSICSVKFLLYFRNIDGTLGIRELMDIAIEGYSRTVETTINSRNAIETIGDWEKYKDYLNLKSHISKGDFDSITFNVPNSEIQVSVYSGSGTVGFYKNGKGLNNYNELLDFIDDVLCLNLRNTPGFLEEITALQGLGTTKALADMAARVIFNQYVQKERLDNIDERIRTNEANKIYNNKENNGLIHSLDIPLLRKIGKAKANYLGTTTAVLVKDGEGNSQSLQSLSRLLGNLMQQWELLELNKDSASNHFLIFNIPGLFENVYTLKEYNELDTGSKQANKMNFNEMAQSCLVYDFIGGLMPVENRKVVGNGHVLFLPSVNADKNTVGRILINLNAEIYVYDENGNVIHDENGNLKKKQLRNFNEIELLNLIATLFGNFYVKMLDKIYADLSELYNSVHHANLLFPILETINVNLFWDTFNTFVKDNLNDIQSRYGKNINTPEKYLEHLLRYLNYQDKHLRFIDQIHYRATKKGDLYFNQVILAQIARFRPDNLKHFGFTQEDINKFPNGELFWKYKKSQILKDLLKEGFKINTSNTKQPELEYIRKLYANWIDASGDLILAKIKGNNGTIFPIKSTKDFIKLGYENYENVIYTNLNNIELNPIITLYNYLDYLITLEFMNSTVGSFVAHPEKTGSNDVYVLESALIGAQNKRNVSMTAAMQEFLLNTLDGITEQYKIAAIKDITDRRGTVTGINSTIKAFDGATFVNPFNVILENNSLGGAKVGITKKQFVHFKDEYTGTGGIIKTAGFGLTNELLRNSPFLLRMMKKMTNMSWYDTNKVYKYDLSHPVNKAINIDITQCEYEDIYYKENGKYYQVVSIEYLGNDYYKRHIQEVKEDGTPNSEIKIEDPIHVVTNYLLWKMFGGENSLEISNNKLIPSESSIRNVVTAMNTIRFDYVEGGVVRTQEDTLQPLKHSDINYVCTEGAIKLGAANINSVDLYYDDNDIPLNYFKINMYLAGILLDKEHHADEADLSLMTLVMSACAARGFTYEQAAALYDALYKQTNIKTSEHLQALGKLFNAKNSDDIEKFRKEFQEIVMKSIIKTLGTSNSNLLNFALIMARDVIKRVNAGENIKFADTLLPLSDAMLSAKIASSINIYLTNSGIKLKIPGVLAVLTPSHEIMKLYADRKYESFENPKEELKLLLKEQIPIYWENKPEWHPGSIEFNDIPIEYNNDLLEGVRYKHNTLYVNLEVLGNDLYSEEYGSFDQFVTLTLFAVTLKDIYPKLNNESNELYAERLLLEASRRMNSSSDKTNIELGRTYIITREILDPETEQFTELTEIKEIQTPTDYYKIKYDNSIVSITENIIVGRNLAGYNVRFKTNTNESYLLWDLDSARFLFELNELKNKWDETSLEKLLKIFDDFLTVSDTLNIFEQNIKEEVTEDNKDELLSKAITYTRRKLQNDLYNLSKTRIDIISEFNNYVEQALNDYNSKGSIHRLVDIVKWYNINFGTGDGSQIEINGLLINIDSNNYHDILNYIDNRILESTQVKINGEYKQVNMLSILISPYEIVMPKVFATYFGLDKNDDLNSIVEDKDFFIKLYIQLLNVNKPNETSYAVGLKSSNGNHKYLLPTSLLSEAPYLRKIENLMYAEEDGVRYRTDSDLNILYELRPGTEIYVDSLGNEIIVTDDLEYYINELEFDSIELSPNLMDKINNTNNILQILKKSKSPLVKQYYRYFRSSDPRMAVRASEELHDITLENYKELGETHPIIRMGREKHTSFLRSLDIIAARIPAQSMQSYMSMKVVAFENPDVNNAYVSTMLLLLQGSDYDIDSVSLAPFDIDSSGKLQLWSPYANITSREFLEVSEELPMPTGLKIQTTNAKTGDEAAELFLKYKSLFEIRGDVDKDGNPSNTVTINLKLGTPELLLLFGKMLHETKELKKPKEASYGVFSRSLINARVIIPNTIWNDQLFEDIFVKIAKIIDRHNMYLDNVSESRLGHIINNRIMKSTYDSIIDPVNQIEGLTSVDGTTGPFKKIGNASKENIAALYRTNGSFLNKFYGINDNSVGKDCIGISAVGLKTFFAATQYCNTILNNGTKEQQDRLLLGKLGTGIEFKGKIYRTLANIRSKSPNTIKSEELFNALANVNNDEDAAVLLSALLSLATDFRILNKILV